jgi:hypothetical protein
MQVVLETQEHFGFVRHLYIQRVDEHDGGGFARIVAATEQGEALQFIDTDTEALDDRIVEGVLRMG